MIYKGIMIFVILATHIIKSKVSEKKIFANTHLKLLQPPQRNSIFASIPLRYLVRRIQITIPCFIFEYPILSVQMPSCCRKSQIKLAAAKLHYFSEFPHKIYCLCIECFNSKDSRSLYMFNLQEKYYLRLHQNGYENCTKNIIRTNINI